MFLSFYTCQETVRRLDDYLDRELSPRELQLVKRHLKICRHCAEIFQFEETLLQEMRAKLQRVQAPPDLMQKIRDTLPTPDAIEQNASQNDT